MVLVFSYNVSCITQMMQPREDMGAKLKFFKYYSKPGKKVSYSQKLTNQTSFGSMTCAVMGNIVNPTRNNIMANYKVEITDSSSEV